MPRRARYPLAEIAHHVVQRGNNRQAVFFSDQDRRYYMECVDDAARRYGCKVHAYVLMPNHVHLLVTPAAPLAIAKMMQSVGRRYVRYVNFRYRRTGTLWEGRYRAALVSSGAYLLRCQQYIEFNPVRALLAPDAAAWPWSSYAHFARGAGDCLVRPHEAYLALGENPDARRAAYRALTDKALDAESVAEIRATLDGSRAYGSKQFERELELRLQRRIAPGKRGRPRKVVAEQAVA